MHSRIALLALLAASSSGCIVIFARRQYVAETNCPSRETKADFRPPNVVVVSGCQGKYVYQCIGLSCTHLAQTEPVVVRKNQPRATQSADNKSLLLLGKGKQGEPMLVLDVELGRDSSLTLRAAPATHPEFVQLELAQIRSARSRRAPISGCTVQVVANERLIALGASKEFLPSDYQVGIRTTAQTEIVLGLKAASQFALGACDQHWSLDENQIASVLRFALALQRERTLLGLQPVPPAPAGPTTP